MSDPVPPAGEAEPRPSPPTAASPPATGSGLSPVQTDTGRIVSAGTAVFLLAFVVLLATRLAGVAWSQAHPTWLWTSLAGAVLGGLGLLLVRRHRRLGRTR